jgi:redox-sensing transcriptional repressor
MKKERNVKILNLQTIKRMPSYLGALKKFADSDQKYISTTLLIDELKYEPVLVRKDLASLGIPGKQRLGYKLEELKNAIQDYLCWNKTDEAFLFGAGALGSALLGYKKLEEYGLKIVAAFDNDKSKAGKTIHDRPVMDFSKASNLIQRLGIRIAILTVPADQAQKVTDVLVEAGIKGIWNFTTAELELPPGVICQNENFASGLALFSVKLKELFEEEEKEIDA